MINYLILVKYGHLQKDVIDNLAARIRAKWDYSVPRHYPRVQEITTAASLAHHKLLRSVKCMELRHVDLASVPGEHLASLAACATERILIENVRNTDLASILESSKSRVLAINNQSLSILETWALAWANAERVFLGYFGEVTLDISTLVTCYNGQGKCKRIEFIDETAVKYRQKVRKWAQRISWRVTRDDSNGIVIKRE